MNVPWFEQYAMADPLSEESISIDGSPVDSFLREQVSKGHLTQAQAELMKAQYAKLHEAVMSGLEKEKLHLATARSVSR